MALALRKIKIYAKLAAIVAVVLVVLLVVWFNRKHQVTVWFFGTFENLNVLWLICITAVASVFGFWVVSKVRSTVKEFRQLRRDNRLQRELGEQKETLNRIEQKERRIDQKLRQGIEDQGE